MPEYKYICANGHVYLEKRPVEMGQIYEVCQNCKAEFTEI
jgi:predicted SprT family Zn-dependent metalloprotease